MFPDKKEGIRLYTTGPKDLVHIDYIGHSRWVVRDDFKTFEEAAMHAMELFDEHKKRFKY